MFRRFNWATSEISPGILPVFNISNDSSVKSLQLSKANYQNDNNSINKNSQQSDLNCSTNEKSTIFYKEHLNEELALDIPVQDVIKVKKTDFQELKILKSQCFGKCLISDNHMQSAESDENLYHEALVHPALLSHPNPETIFIGGGGELATAREVLKYDSVKKVVMVDIDEEAVKICLEMLPEWNKGIIDDSRLEIIYSDADSYLKTCGIQFDVIIMDICDPIECGTGWQLYTKEFYQRIKLENMKDSYSVFCTQSTGASLNLILECFTVINNTLQTVFGNVLPYRCDIPSFGCLWGFHICSDSPKYLLDSNIKQEFIDEEIKLRIGKQGEDSLLFYDGSCHIHMFNLSKYEKKAFLEENRIFTIESPKFIY